VSTLCTSHYPTRRSRAGSTVVVRRCTCRPSLTGGSGSPMTATWSVCRDRRSRTDQVVHPRDRAAGGDRAQVTCDCARSNPRERCAGGVSGGDSNAHAFYSHHGSWRSVVASSRTVPTASRSRSSRWSSTCANQLVDQQQAAALLVSGSDSIRYRSLSRPPSIVTRRAGRRTPRRAQFRSGTSVPRASTGPHPRGLCEHGEGVAGAQPRVRVLHQRPRHALTPRRLTPP